MADVNLTVRLELTRLIVSLFGQAPSAATLGLLESTFASGMSVTQIAHAIGGAANALGAGGAGLAGLNKAFSDLFPPAQDSASYLTQFLGIFGLQGNAGARAAVSQFLLDPNTNKGDIANTAQQFLFATSDASFLSAHQTLLDKTLAALNYFDATGLPAGLDPQYAPALGAVLQGVGPDPASVSAAQAPILALVHNAQDAQDSDLLGLALTMFKISAGAQYLAQLRGFVPALGGVAALANLLDDLDAYKIFNPDSQTPAQYATSLLGTVGLQNNALASGFVAAQVQGSAGKGAVAYLVLRYLADVDDAGFAAQIAGFGAADQSALTAARHVLLNKIDVAHYYSVTLGVAQTDFALLQATLVGVVDTPASVVSAKAAIDASLSHPPVLDAPPSIIYNDTAGNDVFASATGMLHASDADLTPLVFGINGGSAVVGQIGFDLGRHGMFGTLLINAKTGAYGFNPDNAALQALKSLGGESFKVQVSDGQFTREQDLTIIVNGVNDIPVLGGVAAGAVAEDAPPGTAAGALTIADRDAGDSAFVARVNVPSALGLFNLNAAGGWTYALDNVAAQSLRQGQVVVENFATTSKDGAAVTNVAINITGVNDVPVIGGNAAGAVTEDAPPGVATGALTIVDADNGESSFAPQNNVAGAYGSFSITAAGAWTFTLNNAAAQPLGAGDVALQTFAVASFDGTAARNVVISVNGVNDPASISGLATGSYLSLGTTVGGVGAEGQLTVSDVDTAQQFVKPLDHVAGTYGSFSADASGHWRYFPNNGPATIALPEGATGTDSFSVQSFDGSASKTVTISIIGRNEPPVAVADSYSTVQDGALVVDGTGVLGNDSDTDTGTTFTAQLVSSTSHGTLSLGASGGFSYTPTAGYSGSDSFTYRAFDGISSSNTVTVTIQVKPLPVPIDLGSPLFGANGFYINGLTGNQKVGLTASGVGDFNHDGYDDFAFSLGNKVYIGNGGPDLSGITLANIDSGQRGTSFTYDYGFASGTQTFLTPLGDINGDNFADFAISYPSGSSPGGGFSGSVFIVEGRAGNSPILASNLLGAHPFGGFAMTGNTGSSQAGLSVAAGDVNGDGYADIIVGTPFAQNAAHAFVGGATTIFGGPQVSSYASGSLSSFVSAGHGFQIFGANASDAAGTAVAVGDLNGDGFADILVGSPGRNSGAGEVDVVFGKRNPISVTLSNLLPGAVERFAVGARANDNIGMGIAVDALGNAFITPDRPVVAVTAPNVNNFTGTVYLFPGQAPTGQFYNLGAPGIDPPWWEIDGSAPGDYFGKNIVTVPGFAGPEGFNFLIGAPGANTAAGAHAGTAFVINVPSDLNIFNIPVLGTGSPTLLNFGFPVRGNFPQSYSLEDAIGTGDFNGDGLPDLIFGQPGADFPGAVDAGQIGLLTGGVNRNFSAPSTPGNDNYFGAPGGSTVNGGFGNDTFTGGPGNDKFYGNDGDDVFIYDPHGTGKKTFVGGNGIDTLRVSGGQGVFAFKSLTNAFVVDRVDLGSHANAVHIKNLDVGLARIAGAEVEFDNFGSGNGWTGLSGHHIQLVIDGGNGDTVQLIGVGWAHAGTAQFAGRTYDVYHNGYDIEEVIVSELVGVNIIVDH